MYSCSRACAVLRNACKALYFGARYAPLIFLTNCLLSATLYVNKRCIATHTQRQHLSVDKLVNAHTRGNHAPRQTLCMELNTQHTASCVRDVVINNDPLMWQLRQQNDPFRLLQNYAIAIRCCRCALYLEEVRSTMSCVDAFFRPRGTVAAATCGLC